jgi:sporadic carbohydrate cluster 2OG-Fe(II) oxygenase
MTQTFFSDHETSLAERFLHDGYVILEAEDKASLLRIQQAATTAAAAHLGIQAGDDATDFLDSVHGSVDVAGLNDLRLAVIRSLLGEDWLRPAYFSLARNAIGALCGNELAMQRGMGLSVQMPGDTSSLLQLHADVWDGDSPFELVLWTPLVDCTKTKSMYIVPLARDRDLQAGLHAHQAGSVEAFYESIGDDVLFLDVPYGSVLLFSQTLMHGNRVNKEAGTRWSLNCRFKSLLSPYADKKLGEFFEPITLRPATRLGGGYRMPGGFDE